MAFLEELGKTLTDTGKEVATKAKALTETIQLKTQISTEKTKLEEAYAVIGRLYYESNREPEEEFSKAYEAVKASRERIAALEIELTQSEGSKICAVCGAKVSKDSLYCGKCGAPIKEEAAENDDMETVKEEETVSSEETEPFDQPEQPAKMPAAEEDAFVPTEEY